MQVDMDAERFEQEMRNSPNRQQLIKQRNFLRDQQANMARIEDDVAGMLDRLERKIAEELLSRFADAEEYGGTMDAYTVLLAPDRCEGLYTAYLCAQMDFINGEIARYNNDMEIFSAEWDAYAAYLYRTRTHKKSPSFTAL